MYDRRGNIRLALEQKFPEWTKKLKFREMLCQHQELFRENFSVAVDRYFGDSKQIKPLVLYAVLLILKEDQQIPIASIPTLVAVKVKDCTFSAPKRQTAAGELVIQSVVVEIRGAGKHSHDCRAAEILKLEILTASKCSTT